MAKDRTYKVEAAVRSQDLVGESPVWCERTEALWWVDVRRPAVRAFRPQSGTHESYPLDPSIALAGLVLRETGGILLLTNNGIFTFDPPDKIALFAGLESGQNESGIRLNEGKCDAFGRMWCGTTQDVEHRQSVGALYRFDADKRVTSHVRRLGIPNGIAWSPDNESMYFSDSLKQVIFKCDFDVDTGAILNQRIFADMKHTRAWPDGAAVDQEGCLWSAQLFEGKLLRFSPDGSVVGEIQLPTKLVTSCAFGGHDCHTLYITTGSKRLNEEERLSQPLAGALFAVVLPVGGFPEPRYTG
ncbi:MAG: SMP-30/gluconolactonase/LRE family protein [Pseudolabrys sp.]|nr:SMP-30/gluconolactonase/LRE family protein [Pseudolabrys sp.]